MRDFANRFHRHVDGTALGWAGDLNPVDPMAAGTTWTMALARADKPDRPARTFQGYFVSSLGGIFTCTLALWMHGDGADWIACGAPLAAVPYNRGFECPGDLDDAVVFVRITPSAVLGLGATLDLYMEETDAVDDLAVGLRLVP